MYPTVEFFEDIIPFFNQFLNEWIFHGFFWLFVSLFVCLFFSGVIAILGEVEANRYYLWERGCHFKTTTIHEVGYLCYNYCWGTNFLEETS